MLKNEGLNVNFQNPTNVQTAVMRSINRQNSDIWLPLLVAMKEVDNNLQDNEGKTALIHAVENNREQLVRALLLAKADTSIKDKNGKATLDDAIEMGSTKICDMLRNGVIDSE